MGYRQLGGLLNYRGSLLSGSCTLTSARIVGFCGASAVEEHSKQRIYAYYTMHRIYSVQRTVQLWPE